MQLSGDINTFLPCLGVSIVAGDAVYSGLISDACVVRRNVGTAKAPRQLARGFCADTSSKARKHHGFAAFLCFAAVIKSP